MKRLTILRAVMSVMVGVGLVVPTTLLAAASANASPTTRTAKAVTASVMLSSDPSAAFAALVPAERALFVRAFQHQTSVTTVDVGGAWHPSPSQRAAMSTSAAPAGVKEAA